MIKIEIRGQIVCFTYNNAYYEYSYVINFLYETKNNEITQGKFAPCFTQTLKNIVNSCT